MKPKPKRTISAKLESGVHVALTNGRHQWAADEPLDKGGDDSAPNPYEMLLGSLAACTCITLALYCRHKEIPLESVEAIYEFDRIHADDCEDCEEEGTGLLERIDSHVTISGDFTDDQRKRLSQIVGRCPVHKTLDIGLMVKDHVTFA